VLELFHRRRLEAGAGPLRGEAAERQALRAAAGDVFRRFEAEGRVGEPAAWAARRGAVLARLERAVAAEAREGDGLAPALVEHRFEGATALVLADRGQEVRLRGRIDRVDEGPDRIRVVDYKNSADERGHRERIEPEALGATEFQLPAYLLAAAAALPGRRRLEASWLLLRRAKRLGLALDADAAFLAVDEGRRSQVRAAGGRTFADAAVGLVRRIRAGDFPVASRSCAGCALGAICRFETAAEGEG
jgi:hypothetical protein